LCEFEDDFVNKGIDENCSLDIFEMIISINELARELVNKKLLILKQYYVNVKNIKCLLM
jgi:hypothetical protein